MTKALLMVAACLFPCLSPANVPPVQPFNADQLAVQRVVRIHGMLIGAEWFGTGFLINTSNGIRILTNKHVCGDAKQLTVQLPTEQLARTATLLKVAKTRADLCLLKPDASTDLSIGGYDVAPVVGPLPADVTIYGYPHARELTLSRAHITTVHRIVDKDPRFNGSMVMELDSAVLPGSSGSPVLNKSGLIVGVVFGLENHSNGTVTGLAVPLAEVRKFLDEGDTE